MAELKNKYLEKLAFMTRDKGQYIKTFMRRLGRGAGDPVLENNVGLRHMRLGLRKALRNTKKKD